MSIPRSFIDDLCGGTDIVTLIGKHVKLERSGNSYKGLCPFHDEKTASFHVVPDKQFFHCFGCGISGDAIGFLRRYDNLDFYQAVQELSRIQGVEMPSSAISRKESAAEADHRRQMLALLQQAADYYSSMLKTHQFANKAHSYLKKRGISKAVVERFFMGYAPPERNLLCRLWHKDQAKITIAQDLGLIKKSDTGELYDQFRNRIIFPIRDSRGRVRGFGGRAISEEQQPKYLNSTESEMFHKSSLLYGIYESLAQRSQAAWLAVEGYMDVVALHQKGFERVVACLGTAIGQSQIQWLGRYNTSICFAFDGDEAGKRAATKTMHICLSLAADEREYRFAFLPDGEDPDSLVIRHGAQALERLIGSQSIPLSDMFLHWIKQQGNISTLEGKAKIASLAHKELVKVPSGHFRELLETQIREMTGTGYSRRYARKAKAPSIKTKTFTVASQMLLLHFLAAVFNNPKAFAESQPPLIEQIRSLAPYAPDLPLGFFEKIVSEPDGEILMIMLETLDHDQIQSIHKYHKETHESPGAADMNRLFIRITKHYYSTMTSDQKTAYMHSISKLATK